ncbi:MAG: hypothetical protein FD146_347 [Anaerolineaceae bacterium]|nr:MAG: hypothetical protein FD146_347 [Anaerolineaceae bacterium]
MTTMRITLMKRIMDLQSMSTQLIFYWLTKKSLLAQR